MKKTFITIAFASVAGMLFGGNVCTWTGRGSDNKWGTPENWDAPPVSGQGDQLVLNDAGETENDIEGFEIGSIVFGGTADAKLVGKTVSFAGGTTVDTLLLSNAVVLAIDTPLNLAEGGKGYFMSEESEKTIDFNGRITLGAGALLRIGRAGGEGKVFPRLTFNAPIEGPEATVLTAHGINGDPYWQAGIWFMKPVRVKYFSAAKDSGGNNIHFCASGNVWEGASVQFAYIVAEAEDAFSTTGILDWRNTTFSGGVDMSYEYVPESTTHSRYDLNGNNQTIDRICNTDYPDFPWGDPRPPMNAYVVNSDTPAVLTMKATGDGRCHAVVNGKVSLVWDPEGNYTMIFSNRVNTTEGDIDVRRGTVRLEGAGTFANVGRIVVRENAAFDLDSTAENALAGIQSLTVGKNAAFTVSPSALTPFGASAPVLSVSGSSRLVVPNGTTLNVRELFIDGLRIYGQTYGGGTNTWLSGGGTVVVEEGSHTGVIAWRNALDGDWTEAANWLGGTVPGENEAAEVNVTHDGFIHDGDYAAKIHGDIAYSGDLTVANAGDGTATVEVVSGTWTRGAGKLDVRGGGAVEVDDGSGLTVTAGGEAIVGGGTVRVNEGGVLSYTGMNVDNLTSRCFDLSSGGRLEIAGQAIFSSDAFWGHSLYMTGGEIEVTGNGVLDIRVVTQGGAFGNGTVEMKDSSTLFLTNEDMRAQIPVSRDQTLEKTVITFSEHAKLVATSELLLGNNRLNSVANERNEATLNFDSDASSSAKMVYLGVPNGLATLNMSNGSLELSSSLHAGACRASDLGALVMPYYYWADTILKPEGRINVSGGELSVIGASYDVMSFGSTTICGLVLGDGVSMPTSESPFAGGYDAKGVLTISGGAVILSPNANLVVGGGFGSGRIDQTGGVLDAKNATYGAIVGFLGATGDYSMGGGEANFACDLYVGGVAKSVIGWNSLVTVGKVWAKEDLDVGQRHDAVGTLTVTGGVMTVARDLVFSADGSGSLAIGAEGSLKASSITFGDSSELGGGKTAVSFRLGPTGSGLVETSGALTVAPGTTLTVDARAYQGEKGVKLLKCASMSGGFDESDIAFIPPTGRGCRLIVRETGISMSSGRGSLITIR